VVHRDVVTPRLRSLGLLPVNCEFPSFIVAPQLYEKRAISAVARAKFWAYDTYLSFWRPRLRAVYRRARQRLAPSAA